MFKQRIQLSLVLVCLLSSGLVYAKPYPASDRAEIKRLLQNAGLGDKEQSLLIRRLEARKVPPVMAKKWTKDIHELKKRKLPVQVAVDRLQQGLIKNIKVGYLDKALNVLLNNLAWSNDLVVNKVVGDQELAKSLDTDEQALLNKTTSNLEVAARQGYKRNELTVVMSRKGVDLELAAEISKTLTVWTNYGVTNKRVLLSLKRAMRVKMNADQVKSLRESVDSKVVSENMSKPAEISKVIWHEIRHEAGVMDAEHAYKTRMSRNPHSIKGTGGSGDSGVDDLNISDVETVDTGDSGGGGGGAGDGGGSDDMGAGAGTDSMDTGSDIDSGGGDSHESDSHESESYESDSHEVEGSSHESESDH